MQFAKFTHTYFETQDGEHSDTVQITDWSDTIVDCTFMNSADTEHFTDSDYLDTGYDIVGVIDWYDSVDTHIEYDFGHTTTVVCVKQ